MHQTALSTSQKIRQWRNHYRLVIVVCLLVLLDKCEAFGNAWRQQCKEEKRNLPVADGSHASKSASFCRRAFIQKASSSITAISVLTTASHSSNALSPQDASSAYDSYASSYDALDGGAASDILGIDGARTQLLSKARGRVLEIGVGTGLNLSKYNPEQVKSLTVAEISDGMLQEAKARAKSLNLPFPVDFVKADATSQLEDLFGKNAFDTVVDSFSLCVMGNEGAKACLTQLSEVVKTQSDGGRVLLLENSRSSNPIFAAYQDITADAAASVGGKGCVYNQDVGALIKGTRGLAIQQETSYVAGLFRSYECTKTP